MTGPVKKGSFLLFSGPVEHLHFICSDSVFYPNIGKNCYLAVNLSSIKDRKKDDLSCEVCIGDHSFVTRNSFIYYEKADIFGADTFINKIEQNEITVLESCSDELFSRIMAGFRVTDKLTLKVEKFFKQYCLP